MPVDNNMNYNDINSIRRHVHDFSQTREGKASFSCGKDIDSSRDFAVKCLPDFIKYMLTHVAAKVEGKIVCQDVYRGEKYIDDAARIFNEYHIYHFKELPAVLSSNNPYN